MHDALRISEKFFVHPDILWNAWMDSREHSDFTESEAEIDPRPGGLFTAAKGYVNGKTLELDPGQKIIQSWRTKDFQESDSDSILELTFTEIPEGCLLNLYHYNLPSETAEEYTRGWEEYYFKPMRRYFQ